MVGLSGVQFIIKITIFKKRITKLKKGKICIKKKYRQRRRKLFNFTTTLNVIG